MRAGDEGAGESCIIVQQLVAPIIKATLSSNAPEGQIIWALIRGRYENVHVNSIVERGSYVLEVGLPVWDTESGGSMQHEVRERGCCCWLLIEHYCFSVERHHPSRKKGTNQS